MVQAASWRCSALWGRLNSSGTEVSSRWHLMVADHVLASGIVLLAGLATQVILGSLISSSSLDILELVLNDVTKALLLSLKLPSLVIYDLLLHRCLRLVLLLSLLLHGLHISGSSSCLLLS